MAAKKMTPADAAADLQSRNHKIAKGKAAQMVKAFEKAMKKLEKAKKDGIMIPEGLPAWPKAFTFNKKVFQALLKKPDVQGIRIFPALAEDGFATLVVVAVDSNGNNIKTVEEAASAKKVAKKAAATAMSLAPSEMDNDAYDEAQRNPPFPGDISL